MTLTKILICTVDIVQFSWFKVLKAVITTRLQVSDPLSIIPKYKRSKIISSSSMMVKNKKRMPSINQRTHVVKYRKGQSSQWNHQKALIIDMVSNFLTLRQAVFQMIDGYALSA